VVHSVTCHEGTEREYRYISALSLTSVLDGRGWSMPCPRCFTPRMTHYPPYGRLGGPRCVVSDQNEQATGFLIIVCFEIAPTDHYCLFVITQCTCNLFYFRDLLVSVFPVLLCISHNISIFGFMLQLMVSLVTESLLP
jgi:hypothetical protein